jgi:hypothetical protein
MADCDRKGDHCARTPPAIVGREARSIVAKPLVGFLKKNENGESDESDDNVSPPLSSARHTGSGVGLRHHCVTTGTDAPLSALGQ